MCTRYCCLILLKFPPNDEHSVAFAVCCQLLHTADALESLHRPSLGQDHEDLETVTDLKNEASARVLAWGVS